MTDDNRTPKKSEMLEVRLDYETKRDFLAACRNAGRTASDVVREHVRSFIDAQAQPAAPPAEETKGKGAAILAFIPAPIRKKRFAAIGVGVLALTTFTALPSAADPNFRRSFDRLDLNHDGKLTREEFSAAGVDNLAVFENATVEGRNLPARDVALRMAADYGEDAAAGPPARGRTVSDFARFDANADAGVTYEEFTARYLSMLRGGFEALDTNGDGRISESEFAGPLNISADSITSSPRNEMDTLPRRLDRNGDGVVTYEEYIE